MNTVNELNMHAFYEEMPQTQNYDLFLQEKLRGIYENYQGFHTFSFPKESVENYEEMKKYLLMEVLPLHRCTELPHKKILDFGLVFRLAGRKGNENLLINQDLARMYGKSGEELYQDACLSSPLLKPVFMHPLPEVLKMPDMRKDVYVITNEEADHGAGVLFYPGMLEEAACVMKGNYFVLTSSIHELLLVKEKLGRGLNLEMIVRDINLKDVPAEEQLSDRVYFYDAENEKLDFYSI